MQKLKSAVTYIAVLTGSFALPVYSYDVLEAYEQFSQETKRTLESVKYDLASVEQHFLSLKKN